MALKEFKGRMLPSALLSTLTVMSSVLLWCGSFSCKHSEDLSLALWICVIADAGYRLWPGNCGKWLLKEFSYYLGLHGGLLSGLSAVHGGLHYLYGGYLNGLERRLTLCYVHFWSPGCFFDLDCWCLPLPLCPSGCAVWDHLSSSSWLLGPALSTKMVLISTFMTLFAPCWAFSRWMRCSTLTTYFTLTSGPGSSPRSPGLFL